MPNRMIRIWHIKAEQHCEIRSTPRCTSRTKKQWVVRIPRIQMVSRRKYKKYKGSFGARKTWKVLMYYRASEDTTQLSPLRSDHKGNVDHLAHRGIPFHGRGGGDWEQTTKLQQDELFCANAPPSGWKLPPRVMMITRRRLCRQLGRKDS